MAPTELSGEARVASWRVFALVLLSASYFFQSSGHNEAARFDQMRSVREHGEWWIDRFASNTADTIHLGGHTFPNKAPGTTLLGLAPWSAVRAAFRLLPLDEPKQLVLVTWALTILMSALPSALTSLLILRFLARNGWSLARSTLVATGYGLGTIAFPWATTFFGHQLAACFAFGGFYLVWSARWITDGEKDLRLISAGLLIGFLPVIEYPGAIASGLISLYALVTVGLRGGLPVIAGAALGLLPLPLYNLVVLGNPTLLSYGFYKDGSGFPAHQHGFMGVSLPRLDVLAEITFRPQRGLFHANPWLLAMLIAPLSLRRAPGLRLEAGLFAVIFLSFLMFNAGFGDSIVYWGGAFSFGPRHLLIALPFAAILAAFPMRSDRVAPFLGALIVVTILLMLPAAAVDPRLPFEPKEPFLGFYFPLYSRALFSTYPWATFTETALFGSSGAFNLGRAAGLPRDLEILPLTLVWAAAAILLFKGRTGPPRAARWLGAALVIALGVWPAWPHFTAGSTREAGLCQSISTRGQWPYFFDYAVQKEPSANPVVLRVPSPVIPYTNESDTLTSGTLASVAVTFSGRFQPKAPGWQVFRVDVIGQTALYIDGLLRLKIEGPGDDKETSTARVYLSDSSHELIVRYMSDKQVRQLSVSLDSGEEQAAPLEDGLYSGECR